MINLSEHEHQVAFFKWLGYAYPKVTAFAIPNGGQRHKAVAVKLKAEGVKAGVPDIFIADGKPGLFIELKAGNGIVSEKQKEMIYNLISSGYRCSICYGWEEAKYATEMYLTEGK